MAVIKQYVNLTGAAATTNIHGPTRTVRVAPNDRAALLPTDRAEWWCMPVGANNTDVQYIQGVRRVRPRDNFPAFSHLTGTTSSGHFQTQVSLPYVGGDQYEVKVCKETDHRDPAKTRTLADTFETWRKIYYTVYYMGADCFNFFNFVEPRILDAFGRGYIELEKLQMIPTMTVIGKVNADAAETFLDGTPDAILDLSPLGAGRLPSHATTKPYHLATVVVPDVYETAPRHHLLVRNNPADNLVVNYLLFQQAGNTTLRVTDCVTTARTRWAGHPAWINALPRMTLVSATRATAVVAARSELSWDLRPVPGLTNHLAAAAGNNYELDLRTIEERHNFVGYNVGNFCIVETVSGVTSALQTFTHEVGHAVGQAVQQEAKWDATVGTTALPAEPNPRWHTDNFGGQGPHCWHNAVLSAAAAPAGHTAVFVHGGGGDLCTMFYADEPHVDPNGRFCHFCEPRLRRQSLDHTRQTCAFWNHYG
jgi:hypothetical protein